MSKFGKVLRWLLPVFILTTILALVGFPALPAHAESPGFALGLDGVDDYISFGGTNVVMGGSDWVNNLTVEVWVNPTGAASSGTPATGELIAGVDYPRLFGITRAIYSGQDRIWVWNSDGTVDAIGVPYTAGEWMHLALVHSGGMLSAYKNGVLVGTVASGATYIANGADGKVYVGGTGRSGAGFYLEGQVDEVRLWRAGVDPATLLGWMNQGLNASHPYWSILGAYYKMSDGGGVSLSDDSGHGHTGSLLGGMGNPNWVPSGAFGISPPPATPTYTPQLPSPTNTPDPSTATFTPLPPTPTQTNASLTPTSTNTPAGPSPTLPPTSTPPPTGGAGYALSFDGVNDYVQLASTLQMMGAGWQDTNTVALWVKPTGSAPVCGNNSVAWCDNILGDRPRWWGISRGSVNGYDRIWVWNTDGSVDSGVDAIGLPYVSGEWIFVGMTHSGGNLCAYLNGALAGCIPSGTTQQPNTGAQPVLHLGGVINNPSRNWTFEGVIDEVSIWNRALSAQEIATLMNQILIGSESGLKAYYRMSDGSGATLTDDSQFNWTGTLFDGGQGVPPNGSLPAWVTSGAFGEITPSPTPTASPVPASPTPTDTVAPPTQTFTPFPATDTPTPGVPTITPTPTDTAFPATDTPTSGLPTSTPVPTDTPSPQTATPTATSQANLALQLDGVDDHISFGGTNVVMGGSDWVNNLTVEVWVNPTGAASSGTPATGELIAGVDYPRLFGITRAIYSGQDRIWVWNSDGTVDAIGVPYTAGEWMHLALVHSGGMLSAYKNGVLVGTVASGATYIANGADGKVYVGGTGRSGAGFYLEGQVDEVRLWRAGVDPATLLGWMNQGLNASHPYWSILGAYYKMSDGGGVSLSDDSGHGHTGSLLGGMGNPNWVPSGAPVTP